MNNNIPSKTEDNTFIDWLKQKNVKQNLINKLIKQYNSMYV